MAEQNFNYKAYFGKLYRERADYESPEEYIIGLISYIRGDTDFILFHKRMWEILKEIAGKKYDIVAAHPERYVPFWLEGLKQYYELNGIE